MRDPTLSGGSAKLLVRTLGAALLTALMAAGSVLPSIGVPASAAVANPAPVLTISNSSPRVGEVVTISNTGTCGFGGCSDNLKWFPMPMAGPHLGTQIGTFSFPATAVAYSWSSPGYKQIGLTSRDGQSRLCCSGSTSMVITVLPTTPAPPSIGSATGGNASASVFFSAPSSDGGSALTGFTVTATPGGMSASGPASPILVSGLSNGTAYTFTVHATNTVGNSLESAPSNAVTPAPVPDAPIVGAATAGNALASVSFAAPAFDGGSAITGYTVTASPGGPSASGAASPITVSGLSNGTAYTFTVHATNAVGNSLESARSNVATPATVPDPPVIGPAARGNAFAFASFTAPSFNGGSAITGYTVTASPGGASASGAASPITVSGLSNGTAYTFTVHATNAVGNSVDSAPSSAVTPATVPDAPIVGSAAAGIASASVSFTAPSFDGGSAITGYTVTASPGGMSASGPASPITVSGLSSTTYYTLTVHATSAVGDSVESAASNAVTPAAPAATQVIAVSDVRVTETNGPSTAAFTVSLSEPARGPVSVGYATADSTARAPADYTAAAGTLSFAAGEQIKTVPVTVAGDSLYEQTEKFFLNLTSPSGATIAGDRGTATIRNDDPVPSITIADAATAEGNLLTSSLVFTVRLSTQSGAVTKVNFATENGTATAGSDYTAATGTVSIPAGATSSTFTVAVTGDVLREADETLLVNLTSPVNATIADAQGVGTIVNDD